jgi:hypothetical protein
MISLSNATGKGCTGRCYVMLCYVMLCYVMLCYFTTHCSLRLIVRSELDVPTFATRRLHACHHATAPSGGKVELWARNVWEFCLNAYFYVTFRDLLLAVKLRHGTDGFTSPPKEGVLRIFLP